MTVLDASAILAFVNDEPGATTVEELLEAHQARCSAANWSEVAQKVRQLGNDWPFTRSLLRSYALVVEPVTADDAERAAVLWQQGGALSLADRLCLALGDRLSAPILTADAAWAGLPRVELIR